MSTIEIQPQHEHHMLPQANHDERAREDFVRSLKRSVVGKLVPGVNAAWQVRVRPSLGHEPKDRHEVRRAMVKDPYVRMTFALRRAIQEQLWDNITEIVERQLDDLSERAKEYRERSTAGGTLTLDPGLEIPRYLRGVDIHCMPTGYWTEVRDDDDVAAGAIYDRGVYVYALGQIGPLNDQYGHAMFSTYLQPKHPGFSPRRILDMGCTVGHSTLPYLDHYPEAEVHGIDVSAPALRYAHARAEALGKTVHFSQQNAEKTAFPDEHFDLVISHAVLHETSRTALSNIFAESHRLLAPGGIMIHAEAPQFEGVDTYTQFLLDYDTYYNNEPFWGAFHDTDLKQLATDVGFDRPKVSTDYVPTGRATAERTGVQQKGPAGHLEITVAEK